MKVQDIMTRDVATCAPESSLNEAARLMWELDCGFVPVTASGGRRLLGVLTDRDICMAAYTQNLPISRLSAEAAMCHEPQTCRPSDDLAVASKLMRTHQLHRLPVTDDNGDVVGVISLNDLALAASQDKGKQLRQEVIATLGGICRHRVVAAAV